MQPIASVQAIRDAEAGYFRAHPGADLMRRAAQAVADEAVTMLDETPRGKRVVVLVGPGNNGGDGLFAAANLASVGASVAIWPTGSTRHEGGSAAALKAGVQLLDTREVSLALGEADLVIDAVLGIGGRPGLSDAVANVAAETHDLGVPVLAVDVPSGLDADSHQLPNSYFRADTTITFIAAKLCHLAQPAASACGRVRVVDIGVDQPASSMHYAQASDIARLWPWPTPLSDKYSRGVVGLDTGSADYSGAALLGCYGATYSGAGMVRFAGGGTAAELIRSHLPNVVIGAGRVQAWVCGSGWGPASGNAERLAGRVSDDVAMVIDADALTVLAGVTPPANSLLTPHAGELARLLGVERATVEADPIAHAQQAASNCGATVLLKGATQYAVSPDGQVQIAVPGPAWTAQAGSGDTLAGVCGTLLAAGLSAIDAATVAASLQAMTATRHPGPFPPDAVARWFPDTLAELARATDITG